MLEELKTTDDLAIENICNGLGIHLKCYSYGKATTGNITYNALQKLCQEFYRFKTTHEIELKKQHNQIIKEVLDVLIEQRATIHMDEDTCGYLINRAYDEVQNMKPQSTIKKP